MIYPSSGSADQSTSQRQRHSRLCKSVSNTVEKSTVILATIYSSGDDHQILMFCPNRRGYSYVCESMSEQHGATPLLRLIFSSPISRITRPRPKIATCCCFRLGDTGVFRTRYQAGNRKPWARPAYKASTFTSKRDSGANRC